MEGFFRVQGHMKKRLRNEEVLEEEFYRPYKKRKRLDLGDEDDEDITLISGMVYATAQKKQRKIRSPSKVRDRQWWFNKYTNSPATDFKKSMRIERETFNMILDVIRPYIEKVPTNLNKNPITPDRQLGLTLYRLGHGVTYTVLEELFGVSESLAAITFNKVCRVLTATLYKEYVKMPQSNDEWEAELKGFIENYEFPTIGAWDGFHVYVSTKLKPYFSFKKRYTMTNLALVGHNKRVLFCTVGAPGSTHDARLLRNSKIYDDILNRKVIPEKGISLGNSDEIIPLVTLGDSAFPKHSWLIKCFNEETRDPKERYFNKKLCSARVVTENFIGMMKGRFRFLYKKNECRLSNLKYVIMTCVMLHNLCIAIDDPCLPRWKLKVKQIKLIPKQMGRFEDKKASETSRSNIADWLWHL